jgi:nucleoid-associated protein YgaU
MQYSRAVVLGMLGLFVAVTGCARVTTQVVDKPRVDQGTQGNRGYLVGSGPAAPSRKLTRQMVQTDVELPTWEEMNPWRKRQPAAAAPIPMPAAAPKEPVWEEPVGGPWLMDEPEPVISPIRSKLKPAGKPMIRSKPETSRVQPGSSYTVQKGDTLEKISQRFYGTTKKWRRIYDANRAVLKSPDRVYPGQKLQIPPVESSAPAASDRNFK